MRTPIRLLATSAALAFVICGFSSAQIFQINTAGTPMTPPGTESYAENVDFADVDLDGDWDVAITRGGDLGNLQDRLWINQGGLQGGSIGVFADETSARFPAISRLGRDIEFVDYDGDGDPDLHISNSSSFSNQSNLWWTNLGGKQAGNLGYYLNQTKQRWVGLGIGNSSVPPSLIFNSHGSLGGFIDWCSDSDFGDIDNDGDLDLIHSSDGNLAGQVPTRLFLNDGDGYFEEFNPSGFQLARFYISDGDPALWAEGTQQNQSTDSSGQFADIAGATNDVELADFDGDFDLDLLIGDRDAGPRLFLNRLSETGSLSFRDRTTALFPPGYTLGLGQYEQELGDLDGDGDLDLFGINWQSDPFVTGFEDATFANNGDGSFGNMAILPESGSDDNEGDFLDYDGDGDLDLYIANFAGDDRLYENQENGTGSFSYLKVPQSISGLSDHGKPNNTVWDAEAADLDGDGDYDVIAVTEHTFGPNYWENTNNVPDTSAPYLPNVESLSNQVAGTSGTADLPVRAHVYDNAPYYITWYNPTWIELEVDGIALGDLPAKSSGGQVFRAELPSNLVGQVAYRFGSSDEHGNSGSSQTLLYDSSTVLNHRTIYGSGTDGSLGALVVDAKSIATEGKPLFVTLSNTPAGTLFVQFVSLASAGPLFVPGSGFVNVDSAGLIPSLLKLGLTDASGDAARKLNIPVGIGSGFSTFWQFFTLDGQAGETWASSEGLEIPFLP